MGWKTILREQSVKQMQFFFSQLSPEVQKQVGTLLAKGERSPLKTLLRWYYEDRPADAYLISFPKCGRTWLRLMIGYTLAQHFDLKDTHLLQKMLELDRLAELNPAVPKILVTHDDDPHWKTPDELIESKEKYKDTKVIFLVRDPRDVIISTYFEQKKRSPAWVNQLKAEEHLSSIYERIKPYDGDLHGYLYEEVGSLKSLIKFYNIWAKNQEIPKDFLLLRYEDLKQNTVQEIRRVINFLDLASVTDEILAAAVDFASFDKMRQMEKDDVFKSDKLRPADKSDEESYKTRKGKVGGYKDYLNQEEVKFLNQFIDKNLSDFYHYKAFE